MYIYIYIYVCMYVYMYIYIYMYTYMLMTANMTVVTTHTYKAPGRHGPEHRGGRLQAPRNTDNMCIYTYDML